MLKLYNHGEFLAIFYLIVWCILHCCPACKGELGFMPVIKDLHLMEDYSSLSQSRNMGETYFGK